MAGPSLTFFLTAPARKIFFLILMPFIVFFIAAQNLPEGTAALALQICTLVAEYTALVWTYTVCRFITAKYGAFLTVPIQRFNHCIAFNAVAIIVLTFDLAPGNLLLLLLFAANAAAVYCSYFLARLMVMAERRSSVSFRDYAGTFIAIFFLVFGIWNLQPRVNRIYASED